MEKLKFEINLKDYPKNAVYATAYCFLDEAYISLEFESVAKNSGKDKDVAIVIIEGNDCNKNNLKDVKSRFLKELAYSTIRNGLAKKNKKIREAIVAQALFSAIGGFGKTDDCEDRPTVKKEENAKNIKSDPLGISLAWEDKYKKD